MLPIPANAGLFSFVAELFKNNQVPESPKTINTQNMALLKATTSIDPNSAKGGGDIMIVENSALLADSGPLGTMADIEEFVPTSDEISVYKVRRGDTLSGIAETFKVSVNTIMWANNISKNGTIKEGQELIILPISGIKHTIKKGDSLKSVANKYGGDVDEILSYNGLSKDAVLVVGQEIIIPGGNLKETPSSPSKTSASKRFASLPEYSGYYIRPMNCGRKNQCTHGYNGVDLAPSCKCSGVEPILAAASGKVIISRTGGWNGGFGTYIVIAHNNGTQTLYGHNSSNIVQEGWTVEQGQTIGYVGSTGNSTGPHLHFEIRGARNPF